MTHTAKEKNKDLPYATEVVVRELPCYNISVAGATSSVAKSVWSDVAVARAMMSSFMMVSSTTTEPYNDDQL